MDGLVETCMSRSLDVGGWRLWRGGKKFSASDMVSRCVEVPETDERAVLIHACAEHI